MHKYTRYIVIGLALILALPLVSLNHTLKDYLLSADSVSECGCPAEQSPDTHDDSDGDCDSNCHCACHIAVNAAPNEIEFSHYMMAVRVADARHLIPPSHSPQSIERPPRTAS